MSARTEALAARRPTADDLADYRRDGFLVVRDLVPAEVLDAAERGMARFYAGGFDAPFPAGAADDVRGWRPEHGDVLRKNDYASLMSRDLTTLVRWPGIAAFAAGLAGSGGIRLWHDQLLYKPGTPDAPGTTTGNVGWHTDRQYWRSCSSEQMLTCWVPFHDCDEQVGGVSFVAGSHRWADQQGLDFFVPDLAAQEESFVGDGTPIRKVVPTLRRGDVTFHHSRTVHGSGPNLTTAPRRSIAIHLQPAENVHVEADHPGGGRAWHVNDQLVRQVDGAPDYADPAICPVLWPVAGR